MPFKPQFVSVARLLCFAFTSAAMGFAQNSSSTLPATAPTSMTAPIAAVAVPADRSGTPRRRAEVTCNNGELYVHADNSSLNGILRSIAHCTGMRITGGVADQRVFGNYGPAAPATVLATLLDGTGSNMLLLETASNQPAELVLTPRNGGPTPPSPNVAPDEDVNYPAAQAQPAANQPTPAHGAATRQPGGQNATAAPAKSPYMAVPGLPQGAVPQNNVMGDPSNTSPTASTFPTTNSVSPDSLPTPSTTPTPNGIVDAPNPPPAGSDTARMMNQNSSGNSGSGGASAGTNAAPAATNPATPDSGTTPQPGAPSAAPSGALTPQQVYQQLQQMQQQKQQQTPATTSPQ